MTAKTSRAFVPGAPRPKARPRFSRQGRAYTPRESRSAEEALAYEFWVQLRPLGRVEVRLDLELAFSTRRSGDLDNCLKLVMDALKQARIYADDRQVRELHVNTLDVPQGHEYTEVEIEPL